MDKGYVILQNIQENSSITQRELSSKTGISLGSINILLNKMIKEGLIKMEKIPSERVLYMLTPKGMIEKINKTYNYIKIHYNYLNNTKEKLKEVLRCILESEDKIYILVDNDEVRMLAKQAIAEIDNENNIIISNDIVAESLGNIIITFSYEQYLEYKEKGYRVINVLERL